MLLIPSLGAVGAAYFLAVCFYPALRLPAGRRLGVGLVLAAGIALAPLLVPPSAPVARLGVAIYTLTMLLGIWDLHLGAGRGERPRLKETLAFLANPLSLVHRRRGLYPQPRGWRNVGKLLAALLVCAGGWAALMYFVRVDWSTRPFLLEHAAKAISFFVFATALFDVMAALIRALGGSVTPPLDRPMMSRTPAEFWRRYNQTVGEFLREDVFRMVGGGRHPIRAALVAFLVSGLLHEYLFTLATGEVQGYQTAFFMLHGLAVVLTLRWKPPAPVGIPATFAFNVVSSVLFFASFEGLGGFYQAGPPGWLWGS